MQTAKIVSTMRRFCFDDQPWPDSLVRFSFGRVFEFVGCARTDVGAKTTDNLFVM